MVRYNATGTGYNPVETILKPPLHLKWSYPAVGVVSGSPVVSNGSVYLVAGDGRISVLDASTGSIKSSYLGGIFRSAPAVDNGVVYAGADDGRIYALDAATLATKWTYQTGSAFRWSPVVSGGLVYAASGNKLYAITAITGTLSWSYDVGSLALSVPAVSDGLVYASFSDGTVALDATTGALQWESTTSGPIGGYLAVANGIIYMSTQTYGYHWEAASIVSINAKSGATGWKFENSGFQTAYAYSPPAVANGTVYFGSQDLRVRAVDAVTGALKWVSTTGGPVLSPPVVANGVVYIGSNDGKLYGIDAGTGIILWQYDTGTLITPSPAVAGGVLYAGADNGRVYAFESQTTSSPTIPNLSVMKVAGREQAYPGDVLPYLVFLDNSGTSDIPVVVTDTLPFGVSYITNTVSGGAVYSPTINSVLWSGNVPPGNSSLPSAVLQFRARVDDSVASRVISNTVFVSNGAITVTASAGTRVWRQRMFLPTLLRESIGW